MASGPSLNMLSEKIMPQRVNPELLAYCPIMDLIALTTLDQQIHVNRLNGQRVFVVSSKDSTCKVDQIKWKPNGRVLAAAFSDHVIRLVNAYTGKTAHKIDCLTHSSSPVCCLGWALNFTNREDSEKQLRAQGKDVILDDIISQAVQSTSLDSSPDLPLDLAFLDVEWTLPKLSTLPSGGKEDDAFGSRASLDAVFYHLSKGHGDVIDALVIGFEDGTVLLNIYNFFEIGSFNLRVAFPDLETAKPLMHCSHPYSTTHFLMFSSMFDYKESLYLMPLDLRVLRNSGQYLSVLASKSTQLQNLLRYINQVQAQMYNELLSSQDLPRKFIRNIDDNLQEKSDCGWVSAAYHLAVTGHCFPVVKEWLVEELGERGHKRWEKAATTGYENLRRLAHENLLPSLDRAIVVVSRLRGLSRFEESNITLGLSTQELNSILDTIHCLKLLAHKTLILAGAELRQLQAFCFWLRSEIDIQSADLTTASANEIVEKDDGIDHTEVLAYIQGAMMKSSLEKFFSIEDLNEAPRGWDLSADGTSLYDRYIRESKNSDPESIPNSRLPGFKYLTKHLGMQCNVLFERIAENQRRNISFGAPIILSNDVPPFKDVRMLLECQGEIEEFVTYVALPSISTRNIVIIYRVGFVVENGISSTGPVEYASIRVPNGVIKDIKFLDDEFLLLLVKGEPASRLFRIAYGKASTSNSRLRYAVRKDGSHPLSPSADEQLNLAEPSQADRHTQHMFSTGPSSPPGKLEVNGRKGRRVICALAEDMTHYRCFDADSFEISGSDYEDEAGAQ